MKERAEPNASLVPVYIHGFVYSESLLLGALAMALNFFQRHSHRRNRQSWGDLWTRWLLKRTLLRISSDFHSFQTWETFPSIFSSRMRAVLHSNYHSQTMNVRTPPKYLVKHRSTITRNLSDGVQFQASWALGPASLERAWA